jgi:hypothetical protein
MASLTVQSNLGLDDIATNDSTSTVGEPSVGVGGQNIFVTGNWYASRSTNSGASWVHVDPFTTFPAVNGSTNCCDDVVLHDSARGLWIWILQYTQQPSGTNVFKLAACHDADFATGGWYWWDIAPATLDGTWTNLWFDYPDAACTNDALFVTFNMFNNSDVWQRAAAMRFPLDTIANRGTLGFNFFSTTNNGSLRLAQGASNTMYWASHNSNQQLRLFSWADGQNTINWWNVTVSQYGTAISSIAPNGVDWLSRTDTRITGATVGNGVITFMWTAGDGTNRPHAYCKVVRINESNKQLIDEPDIWSNARAWAYPAACTNGSGTLGFTAFYGGVDRNIGHVVGARDDASASWATVYAKLGSDSPNVPKWGDYLTCRLPAPGSATWVAAGYTLEGGDTRREIVPRVVSFSLAMASPAGPDADVLRGEVLDTGG